MCGQPRGPGRAQQPCTRAARLPAPALSAEPKPERASSPRLASCWRGTAHNCRAFARSWLQVAIKKVILDRRYHNRELEMMKQLDNEFVIVLLNSFEKPGRKPDETYLHLVMEYLPETIRSVAMSYHKQRLRFPTDHVRAYLYQALRALEYIHGMRICHRDLKPDNFLVDPLRLRLKLIDFGCAKVPRAVVQ